MTATHSCKTCKFHAHDGGPYGICHRMPPTAGGWPRTAPYDWCGEYVEAPAKPEPVELKPEPVVEVYTPPTEVAKRGKRGR